MLRIAFLCLLLCIVNVVQGQSSVHFPVHSRSRFESLSGSTHSQSPIFRHFTTKQGLPSNECYAVFQDSKGYIWITSDRGIVRYNGYFFQYFTTDEGLPDNTVFKITEDKWGRIWVATFSGKLAYLKRNRFHLYSLKSIEKRINANTGISNLVCTENSLWVSFHYENCLVKISLYDLKKAPRIVNSSINEKTQPGFDLIRLSRNKVISHYNHSFVNPKSKVFPSGYTLYIQNEKCRLQQRVKLPYLTLIGRDFCNTIAVNHEKLLFSHSNNLCIIGPNKVNVLKLSDPSSILYLYRDRKGGIWISQETKGVWYYPNGNLKEKPYQFLQGFSVSSIVEDFSGGYWFSTIEEGVFYLPFPTIRKTILPGAFKNHKITAHTFYQNNIWFGTNKGLLGSFSSDVFCPFYNVNYEHYKNYIKHLFPGQKHLFISSILGVIYANKQDRYTFLLPKLQMAQCSFSGKRNFYFAAIYNLNITSLDHLSAIKTIPFSRDRFFCLQEDVDENLLIGGMKGLWYLRKNQNKIQRHSILYNDRINDLKMSNDTILYIGTSKDGLRIYPNYPHSKKNVILNKKKGLLSNQINSITLDKNAIWISTPNGINRITRSHKDSRYEIRSFTAKNGLLSNFVSGVNVFNDTVVAASEKGFTWFHSGEIDRKSEAMPIYLNKFIVNKKRLPFKKKYYFDYNENNLSFHYLGLYFKHHPIHYEYRIIGLDSIWKKTTYTSQNFTTLPPGDYTFELRAYNEDHITQSTPLRVHFHISPPFWQTWWFNLGSLFFISFIVITFTRYRIRSIEKREREKMELYKKATEMEMRFLTAQMNPHFTFNAMNSVQHFMLNNDPIQAQKYLAKYSKLIRKILENNMEDFVYISKEIELLEIYMDIENLRFSEKFSYSIDLPESITSENILIPPMLLQPYIENAIWHGLFKKPKGETGHISITFQLVDDKIKCVIEDNGIGRKKSAENKESNKKHRSLGMLITRQRMKHLHSENHVNTNIIITDINDNEGNPSGTKVEIWLPFIKEQEE